MAGQGFRRKVPAGVTAPTMPVGMQPPAHRFKSTAKAAGPKAAAPKAMSAPPRGAKPMFKAETPMDKSKIPAVPKVPKVKKPPAIQKPKGFPTY